MPTLTPRQFLDFEPARPCGGYNIHAKHRDKWRAACGYFPSSPKARLMRPRDGWRRVKADEAITCPRCVAALAKTTNEKPERKTPCES